MCYTHIYKANLVLSFHIWGPFDLRFYHFELHNLSCKKRASGAYTTRDHTIKLLTCFGSLPARECSTRFHNKSYHTINHSARAHCHLLDSCTMRPMTSNSGNDTTTTRYWVSPVSSACALLFDRNLWRGRAPAACLTPCYTIYLVPTTDDWELSAAQEHLRDVVNELMSFGGSETHFHSLSLSLGWTFVCGVRVTCYRCSDSLLDFNKMAVRFWTSLSLECI